MPPDEVAGPAPPPPTFDVLKLSAEVRRAIDELGYVHPTPVQRAVYDPATRGADLVVQARTGTGKTAAFGLPIVDALVRRSAAQVQALVLCPTRELALQVGTELEALAKYRGTKVAAVYGGAPMGAQVQRIKDGAQVIVGTPGRVLDHLRRGTLDPKSIRIVVLDESDEMLSMGFLPQIDEILSHLPASRQSLLFSATLPPDVQRLAETRLKSPEFVTLSGDQIGALEIAHYVYISHGDKITDLLSLLEVENPESAIVFCNTRDSTKRVASALQQQGFDADWLNADLTQSEREKVMEATRKGRLRFLVATDVAARGIDISHLTHVINYDFPDGTEAYVHRTGRTGRAGRTGTAISLIEPGDIGNLYMLRLTYKIRPIEKQLPTARDLKTRAEMDVVQMFADLFSRVPAHPDDLALARRVFTHEAAERIVAGLLRDHLGARPAASEQAAAARRGAAPRAAPAATPELPTKPQAQDAPPSPPPLTRQETDPPTEPRPKTGPGGDRRQPVEDNTIPPNLPGPPRSRARPPVARPPVARPPVARPAPVAAAKPAPPAPATDMGRRDNDGDPGNGSSNADEDAPRTRASGTELYVNVGRKDGAKASDFYAVLKERAGVSIDDTEYVNVRQRHTFIGIRPELVERALGALNGALIAGREAKAEPSHDRG